MRPLFLPFVFAPRVRSTPRHTQLSLNRLVYTVVRNVRCSMHARGGFSRCSLASVGFSIVAMKVLTLDGEIRIKKGNDADGRAV